MESYRKAWEQIVKPPSFKYSEDYEFTYPDEIDGVLITKTQLSVLASDKKHRIHASFIAPEGKPPETVVIYLHTFSGSKLEGRFLFEHFLPSVGVLLFDSLGCGNAEGEFVTLGLREQDDLHFLIEEAHRKLKFKKLLLYGRSMGAATIIHYMSKYHEPLGANRLPINRYPYQIIGIVLDSPFTEAYRMIHDILLNRGHNYYVSKMMLLPVSNSLLSNIGYDVLGENKPIKKVDKILTPSYFMIGEHDDLINLSEFKKMFNLFAGKKKKLDIMKDTTHAQERGYESVQRAIDFLFTELIRFELKNSGKIETKRRNLNLNERSMAESTSKIHNNFHKDSSKNLEGSRLAAQVSSSAPIAALLSTPKNSSVPIPQDLTQKQSRTTQDAYSHPNYGETNSSNVNAKSDSKIQKVHLSSEKKIELSPNSAKNYKIEIEKPVLITKAPKNSGSTRNIDKNIPKSMNFADDPEDDFRLIKSSMINVKKNAMFGSSRSIDSLSDSEMKEKQLKLESFPPSCEPSAQKPPQLSGREKIQQTLVPKKNSQILETKTTKKMVTATIVIEPFENAKSSFVLPTPTEKKGNNFSQPQKTIEFPLALIQRAQRESNTQIPAASPLMNSLAQNQAPLQPPKHLFNSQSVPIHPQAHSLKNHSLSMQPHNSYIQPFPYSPQSFPSSNSSSQIFSSQMIPQNMMGASEVFFQPMPPQAIPQFMTPEPGLLISPPFVAPSQASGEIPKMYLLKKKSKF